MSRITHAAMSDLGRVRTENEDRWFVDAEQGLYLVADGMGGTFGGGLAAEAVSRVLPRMLQQKFEGQATVDYSETERFTVDALIELSSHIRQQAQKRLGVKQIGSTIVLAIIRNGYALVASLGDSRAYLLRDGKLQQITKDDSIVQLLLDCGEITPDQVATHPARGQLTRFVGMEGQPRPETHRVELQANDRLLLCSDGLTGMIDDARIAEILEDDAQPGEACRRLVDAANEAAGKDNITVLVIRVGADAAPSPGKLECDAFGES